MSHLSFDASGQIATITLHNSPQNRLSIPMLEEFVVALDAIGGSEARALILMAEGPDFSFGGDIVPWIGMTTRQLRTLFERYLAACNQFERLAIPTIAQVQGLCFGGGLELALRADVVFAGQGARFGHPEQTLAIATMLGGIHRVAERAGRSKAMEWALTSEQVPAEVMAAHGVINRVVRESELAAEVRAFAEKVAEGPTRAHAAHKALLRVWVSGGTAVADEALMDIAMPLFDTEDTRMALPASVEAFTHGKPRPQFPFKGR